MDPRRDNTAAGNEGTPHGGGAHAALPAELAAMEAMLDRLASAERGSAPAGLEDRLMMASRSGLGAGVPLELADAAAAADALAAEERASAGVAFEQRVFVATRAYLGGRREAAVREPEVCVVPGAGRRVAFSPLMRFAAALLVVGAGVAVWVAMRPTGAGTETGTGEVALEGPADPAVQLAMRLDEKLETVLAADWSFTLPEGMEDLSSEMDSLSQQVRSDFFQFGQLTDEEAM